MSTVDSASLLIDGPWEHRFVAANGARFHVAVAGPDDRDAPLVVLLHGVPQFWWAWRHQLPAAGRRGLPRGGDGRARHGRLGQAPAGVRRADARRRRRRGHPVARRAPTRWSSAAARAGRSRGPWPGCTPTACARSRRWPRRTRWTPAGHPRAAVRAVGRPSAGLRAAAVVPGTRAHGGRPGRPAAARVGRHPGLARRRDRAHVPRRGQRPVRRAQPDGAAALAGPLDAPPRRPSLPRGARADPAAARAPAARRPRRAAPAVPRRALPRHRRADRTAATSSSCCRRPATTSPRRRPSASPTCC